MKQNNFVFSQNCTKYPFTIIPHANLQQLPQRLSVSALSSTPVISFAHHSVFCWHCKFEWAYRWKAHTELCSKSLKGMLYTEIEFICTAAQYFWKVQ